LSKWDTLLQKVIREFFATFYPGPKILPGV
jgi:hypothetical protein